MKICEKCKNQTEQLTPIHLDGIVFFVCPICAKSLISDEIIEKFDKEMLKWVHKHNELYYDYIKQKEKLREFNEKF